MNVLRILGWKRLATWFISPPMWCIIVNTQSLIYSPLLSKSSRSIPYWRMTSTVANLFPEPSSRNSFHKIKDLANTLTVLCGLSTTFQSCARLNWLFAPEKLGERDSWQSGLVGTVYYGLSDWTVGEAVQTCTSDRPLNLFELEYNLEVNFVIPLCVFVFSSLTLNISQKIFIFMTQMGYSSE